MRASTLPLHGARGHLMVVLHAHLPYVRQPEHPRFLEEEWFYEAVAETYVPLYRELRALADRGVPFRLTLGITPPLAEMSRDPLLRSRLRGYLEDRLRLAEAEVARTRTHDPRFTEAARVYLEVYGEALRLFDERRGDLLSCFRELRDAGHLEIVTCAATHGYLPLLATREGRRAQVLQAVRAHQRHFGESPRGIWLPECAYAPGLDELLAEAGIQYFFLDHHGIVGAEPPPHGVHAPVRTPGGRYAFGRDPEAGRQVWSATEGYPGDAAYREFYKDIGYEASLEMVRPFLLPDGRRHGVGIKTHRITGKVPLDRKEPYDPRAARERVQQHADHFVASRVAQVEGLASSGGGPFAVVAPYDAELFGHWWFEGPAFLGAVLERLARSPVRSTTPGEWIDGGLPWHEGRPAASSWGDGGFYDVWLNSSTEHYWPHLHAAERRMVALARDHRDVVDGRAEDEATARALAQAARELLLAQASDWTFLVSGGTAPDYADRKIRLHLARFGQLHDQIRRRAVDAEELASLEALDNLFPDVDWRLWA
ncbi:DUF1957 domain-containing protein [Myxococcota bacterium]|nr:DUF1957 domain-containing protein [Myxococcota bacterium]